MSSGIPYPHSAEVFRSQESASEDSWGNPTFGDLELVATIPCWIQDMDPRERAEAASLAETGDVGATHLMFCDVRSWGSNEFLMSGGERYRVLHPTNPDGGSDHQEVLLYKVIRGAD